MASLILTDVTLRDGLQAESQAVSLENKLQLLGLLTQCNFNRLEITSFVNPKWVPQLSDAEALCEAWFKKKQTQEVMAFVPNVRGTERLIKFPIGWVGCFVAASDTFNQKNVKASIDESCQEIEAIIKIAKQAQRRVRIYISTVWGCPYEGAINPVVLEKLFKKISTLEADEIALSDTIGVATPMAVRQILKLGEKYFSLSKIALHFHNTYGLALANIQTGYECGVRIFDGSIGGVGGCPFAKGATGNVASDEIVNLFYRQNILKTFPKKEFETALIFLRETLGLSLNSSLAKIQEKGGGWYGV